MQAITFVFYLALIGLLVWLAWIDIKERRLPNQLVLAVAGVGVAHALIQAIASRNFDPLSQAALGAAMSSVLPLIILLLTIRKPGGPALGMGDVKLLAALGIFTGPVGFLLLPIACTIATIVLLPQWLFRLVQKKKVQGQTLAFGPYILMATLLLTSLQFTH